jgi:indolepyruvate ferredoxin oxidoreductase
MADFLKSPDWMPQTAQWLERLRARAGEARLHALDAGGMAVALMGDAVAANMILLGYAWQQGRIPLSHHALVLAMSMGEAEGGFNRTSFEWGRRAAIDTGKVAQAVRRVTGRPWGMHLSSKPHRFDEIVEDRRRRLVEYQDPAYARRYRDRARQLQKKDEAIGADGKLADAVARGYYKLLADKDEFEVARLFSSGDFIKQIDARFEGDYELHFHLGAWPFGRRDGRGGWSKRELGPWVLSAMNLLRRVRRLRNTWADPFRHSPERQLARRLLSDYEADLQWILTHAGAQTATAAVELANLPDKIQGFGHVRAERAARVDAIRNDLRRRLCVRNEC